MDFLPQIMQGMRLLPAADPGLTAGYVRSSSIPQKKSSDDIHAEN